MEAVNHKIRKNGRRIFLEVGLDGGELIEAATEISLTACGNFAMNQ